MELTLFDIMSIIEYDCIKEFWITVGAATVCLMSLLLCACLFRYACVFEKLSKFMRSHTICSVLSLPLIVYGATKLIPAEEQCDYRIGAEIDPVDGWLNYVRMTGESMPTNIDVLCCNKAITNELTFTHTGQFYIETDIFSILDLRISPFWVRDSETNDWTKAIVDLYRYEIPGAHWLSGWSAAIAHLPDYGNPKDYRYWFIGPESNLPEKIVEGGVGIKIDYYNRDAHHIHVNFHVEDAKLAGATFVLQARNVIDGALLSDWQTIASTTNGVFDVTGDFVSRFNIIRIHADKEME